jgi:D-alanyl-D-alanine carboxypeptidase
MKYPTHQILRTSAILFSTALLFTANSFLHAQSFDRVKLDSLFERIGRHDKAMGSFTIFRDGQEVYTKAWGFADVAKQIPASPETRYRIGSITKTFTAVIIFQLIGEGKLTPDTPLARYFPRLPNADRILISHLLRHRSGLFNFTNDPTYPAWMEKPHSREEMLDAFVRNGTVFEPGVRTEYSNTNYVLLGWIAEDLDQMPYRDILKKRITDPLELKSTYYGGKIDPDDGEALSYTRSARWELAAETDMSVPGGAGAIVSTPSDLCRFFYQLFSGALLSGTSLASMQEVQGNLGAGLFPIPFYERIAFGHNGGIDGFQSSAAYFPSDRISIALTTNGMNMSMNDILIGALSILFGRDYALPEFGPALVLRPEDLTTYLGVYSSPQLPLKVTIAAIGSQITGQGTGQPSFPLEPFEKDKFRFGQAGIVIEFHPDKNSLILQQGGQTYEMIRE